MGYNSATFIFVSLGVLVLDLSALITVYHLGSVSRECVTSLFRNIKSPLFVHFGAVGS